MVHTVSTLTYNSQHRYATITSSQFVSIYCRPPTPSPLHYYDNNYSFTLPRYSAIILTTKQSPLRASSPSVNTTNSISPCYRKCTPTSNPGGNRHLCQQLHLQERLASRSGTTLIKNDGYHLSGTKLLSLVSDANGQAHFAS